MNKDDRERIRRLREVDNFNQRMGRIEKRLTVLIVLVAVLVVLKFFAP